MLWHVCVCVFVKCQLGNPKNQQGVSRVFFLVPPFLGWFSHFMGLWILDTFLEDHFRGKHVFF